MHQLPTIPVARSRWLSRDALIILAVVVAVFAAAAFAVGFVLVGAGGDPGEGGTATASPAVVDAPDGAVAAVWGEPVRVTGTNQSGSESATIEVTLSEPEVSTEITLDNGQVRTPERDLFVVIAEGVIEGLGGIYQYNPNHFQLVPAGELARWDGSGSRDQQPTLVAGVAPNLESATISEETRIIGSLVFDVFADTLDGHVLALRSLLVPDGSAAAYWPFEGAGSSPVR